MSVDRSVAENRPNNSLNRSRPSGRFVSFMLPGRRPVTSVVGPTAVARSDTNTTIGGNVRDHESQGDASMWYVYLLGWGHTHGGKFTHSMRVYVTEHKGGPAINENDRLEKTCSSEDEANRVAEQLRQQYNCS